MPTMDEPDTDLKVAEERTAPKSLALQTALAAFLNDHDNDSVCGTDGVRSERLS
jgi:hypothetical protein